MEDKEIRINQRNAMGIGDVMKFFLISSNMTSSYNNYLVIKTFEKIIGMKRYITDVYVNSNIIYCKVSSSMVREQLLLNKLRLIKDINNELRKQEYFMPNKISGFIKDLILR